MGKKAHRQSQTSAVPQPGFSAGALVATAVVAAVVGAVIVLSAVGHPHTAKAAAAADAPASPPRPDTTAQQQMVSSVPPPQITLDLPPARLALNLGNWSYDQQNWPSAIAYYNEAIRRGLDNPDIRTDLGNAYRFNNDSSAALSEYQIAQKQNPKHENSLFNQGGAYATLGQPSKAVEVWREYLRRFPNGQHVADAQELVATTSAHAGLPAPAP